MPDTKINNNHKSLRLPNYDYTQEGAYFITVVGYQRKCLFGIIKEGKMHCSPIGEIVKEVWQSIPEHFPNTSVDHFIIMPNHIHGIIKVLGPRRVFVASTLCAVSPPISEQFGKPVSGSIPTIIRSFKSEATRRVNQFKQTSGAKLWQSNYYEHVIRNEREYEAIYDYMLGNPQNWEEDRFGK